MHRGRERKNSGNEGQSGEESESLKLEWRLQIFRVKSIYKCGSRVKPHL